MHKNHPLWNEFVVHTQESAKLIYALIDSITQSFSKEIFKELHQHAHSLASAASVMNATAISESAHAIEIHCEDFLHSNDQHDFLDAITAENTKLQNAVAALHTTDS